MLLRELLDKDDPEDIKYRKKIVKQVALLNSDLIQDKTSEIAHDLLYDSKFDPDDIHLYLPCIIACLLTRFLNASRITQDTKQRLNGSFLIEALLNAAFYTFKSPLRVGVGPGYEKGLKETIQGVKDEGSIN